MRVMSTLLAVAVGHLTGEEFTPTQIAPSSAVGGASVDDQARLVEISDP